MENQRILGTRRSIVMILLLSIITCGVYFFIWMYKVTDELNKYTKDYRTSPSLTIVFTFLTCGLYLFYWWYRINQLMMDAQLQTGYQVVSDNKLIYILLQLFGVSFISMAILQTEMNTLWERFELSKEAPVSETKVEDDEWTDY